MPYQNQLLDALSEPVQNRLSPQLELVKLPSGKVLPCGINADLVYFPTDMIASLQSMMKDGATTEIAPIGKEGLIGINLYTGGGITTTRAVVLCGGSAYRLPAQRFKEEIDGHGELEQLSRRYTQSLITQMGQTAVCNRHHTIEQQLCRWLLLMLDRLKSSTLLMTQEQISRLLGVRRESITDAVGSLRRQGIIECRRGMITLLDRHKLEKLSCECYEIIKMELTNLTSYSAALTQRRYVMRKNSDRREPPINLKDKSHA